MKIAVMGCGAMGCVYAALLQDAVQLGVITSDERELLGRAEVARAAAIAVDDFELDTYLARGLAPSVPLGTAGRGREGAPAPVAREAAAAPRPDARAAG